jgi:LysR family transcriptional regulator of gallate degradation
VTALSAQQLHYECESGQLVVLDVSLHNTQRDIGLAVRSEGTPSPAARALIDAIRLAVVDLRRPGLRAGSASTSALNDAAASSM